MPSTLVLTLDPTQLALMEGKIEDLTVERDQLKAQLDLVRRLEARGRMLEAALRLVLPFVNRETGSVALEAAVRALDE